MAAPAAQTPSAFAALFGAYESGDYDAVARALPTHQAYRPFARDVTAAARGPANPLARLAWRKEWRRIQAVFFLEIAIVGYRQSWPDRGERLSEAAAFLTARPGVPGEFREDDVFEVLWHRAALGILQGSLDGVPMAQYLTQMADRIGPAPAAAGQPARLVDGRVALTRAMAAELALLPGGMRRATTADALALLDEAAAFDMNREEALVRRANVLVRTNRAAAAAALLDQHRGPLKDDLVQYWRDLLRGRAHDMLDQLDDAAQAYGDARALAPNAQSPLLALGVLRFRQGNLAEAQHFTALVRHLANAPDPWSLYWHGDARFVPSLFQVLREMSK